MESEGLIIREFIARLSRRGYQLHVDPIHGGEIATVVCKDRTLWFVSRDKILYFRGNWRQVFDDKLAGGQHHMQHTCGHPLLRTMTSSNPHATYDTTCWYEYRAASAGPDSPPVWHCPGCGEALTIDNVREIEDV